MLHRARDDGVVQLRQLQVAGPVHHSTKDHGTDGGFGGASPEHVQREPANPTIRIYMTTFLARLTYVEGTAYTIAYLRYDV